MRVERTMVVLLVFFTWSLIERRQVNAQGSSQPPMPSAVVPLERIGGPTTETGHGPQTPAPVADAQTSKNQVLPSQQAHDFRSLGGNTALAKLRNPFEWEPPQKRGLFGLESPQYAPSPAAPAAPGMPGPVVPGMEGAPGMGTTPSAAALGAGAGAGAEAPGAPSPGAAAPGEAAFAAAAGEAGPGFGGAPGAVSETLNMLGDQGVITIGPGRGGEAQVSIIRNFALNITDNNTAALQNRLIPLEYHHFFGSNRVYPGLPTNPDLFQAQIKPSLFSATRVRTNDDRYVFGFEYILASRLSVLVRQAVVTIDQPNVDLQRGVDVHNLGGIHSGWGDLQISPKYLILNRPNFLLTGGMGVVIPLGNNGPYAQFGNQILNLQPNLLFLTKPTERLYVQGALEYDIAVTDSVHASLFRYVLSTAYTIYSNPDSDFVNAIFPMFEVHGAHLVGDFQQNTINLTTGLRANLFKRVQVGVGYSFPVTQQNQFNNEIHASINIFFGGSGRGGRSVIPGTSELIRMAFP